MKHLRLIGSPRYLICIWLIAALAVALPVQAQYTTKSDLLSSTNLDSVIAAEDNQTRCIGLDASESIDPLNPGLQFEWSTNDGQVLKGAKTRYCFDKPGWKEVALNVYDPATDTWDRRDTVVTFYCSSKVHFEVTGRRKAGARLTFKVIENACSLGENAIYQWDFGRSGSFKEGPKVSQIFFNPGTFKIRLFEMEQTAAGYRLLSANAEEIVLE